MPLHQKAMENTLLVAAVAVTLLLALGVLVGSLV